MWFVLTEQHKYSISIVQCQRTFTDLSNFVEFHQTFCYIWVERGDYMSEIHKIIKQKRKELGLTQEELAKMIGYTNKSTIATIEAGKSRVPDDKLYLFAKALNTTPSELYGWDDAPLKILDVSEEEKKEDAELSRCKYMLRTMSEPFRKLAINNIEQVFELYVSSKKKELEEGD